MDSIINELFSFHSLHVNMSINSYTRLQLESLMFSAFMRILRLQCVKCNCLNKDKCKVIDNIITSYRENKNHSFYEFKQSLMKFWSNEELNSIMNISIEYIRKKLVRSSSTEKKGKLCSICMDKEVDVYVSHGKCVHACICSHCSYDIMRNQESPKCPICRLEIEKIIYMPEKRINLECVCDMDSCHKSLRIFSDGTTEEHIDCTFTDDRERGFNTLILYE